jgi:calcium-dependent protein kinase
MSKTYGTVFYIAPEVLAGQYTAKCDVWSLGVVIYILLCGYVPFGGVTDSEIFESIRLSPLEFFSPSWDAISGSAKDLISNMLNRDVEQRFSMDQCFEHPWI